MSINREPSSWPGQGSNLNGRRAIFVYEGARLQADAVDAPIVPEPWFEREPEFRAQFLKVIEMMCGPDRKTDPEELHDDWVRAYEEMGWKYGPVRDAEKKTHPDMKAFAELPWRERNKDECFVLLCEIAMLFIIDGNN